MLDQAVVTYCICDEVTKYLGIEDDSQCRMTTAEVMTFAIISATMFGCDYKRTRLIAGYNHYFANILSHSRLVRRIHQIPDEVWFIVFSALKLFLRDKKCNEFIVDSFPLKTYENHKSFRARIFSDKRFHGYTASKKQYFFGIKVHMIVDIKGVPIEIMFLPGSVSDIKALRGFPLDLPENSILFGDRAYTDYSFEDTLLGLAKIQLLAKRKQSHKRQHPPEQSYRLSVIRNRIESVFSSITSRMPRHIKVTTEKGFYLKVWFFILAYMVQLYTPLT